MCLIALAVALSMLLQLSSQVAFSSSSISAETTPKSNRRTNHLFRSASPGDYRRSTSTLEVLFTENNSSAREKSVVLPSCIGRVKTIALSSWLKSFSRNKLCHGSRGLDDRSPKHRSGVGQGIRNWFSLFSMMALDLLQGILFVRLKRSCYRTVMMAMIPSPLSLSAARLDPMEFI